MHVLERLVDDSPITAIPETRVFLVDSLVERRSERILETGWYPFRSEITKRLRSNFDDFDVSSRGTVSLEIF